MSDSLKRSLWWIPYLATCVGAFWFVIQTSVAGGEILHEIKGLRYDVNAIKSTMVHDREDMLKVLRDMQTAQRMLERRVEILELYDSVKSSRGIKQ
jgi:hypothetical protein